MVVEDKGFVQRIRNSAWRGRKNINVTNVAYLTAVNTKFINENVPVIFS